MAGGIFAFPRFLSTEEEEGMGAGRYTRLVFRERSTDLRGGREGMKTLVLVPTLKIVREAFVHERSPRFSTLRLLPRFNFVLNRS